MTFAKYPIKCRHQNPFTKFVRVSHTKRIKINKTWEQKAKKLQLHNSVPKVWQTSFVTHKIHTYPHDMWHDPYTHEILSVVKRGQQKMTPFTLWMNFVASSFVVEWTRNNCWMARSEYFQFFLLQLTNLWKSAPKKLLIFTACIIFYIFIKSGFWFSQFWWMPTLFLLGQNIFTLLANLRRCDDSFYVTASF